MGLALCQLSTFLPLPPSIWYKTRTTTCIYRVPTQIVFLNSLCFKFSLCQFPQFGRPIQLLEKNRNFRVKYHNILYLGHQEIYNLNKQNSLCFGKIAKFPVFSQTGNYFCHFRCFPCAVGTLAIVPPVLISLHTFGLGQEVFPLFDR